MLKRKCVRRAIVELSDSENDQVEVDSDDCVIVESGHVIARTNKASSGTCASSPDFVDRIRSIRGTRKGESHEIITDNKSQRQGPCTVVHSSTRRGESKNVACRGRKRKSSESLGRKMGQDNSKSEQLRKREKELERKTLQLAQQEEELRRARALEKHFHEKKLEEEAKLRKNRDEWERQQYLNQQTQQCQPKHPQWTQPNQQWSQQNQQWVQHNHQFPQQNPQWHQNIQQQQQQQQYLARQQFQQNASIPQINGLSASFETQILTPTNISPGVKPFQGKPSAPPNIYTEPKIPQTKASALPKICTEPKIPQTKASALPKIYPDLKPIQTKTSTTSKVALDPKTAQTKVSTTTKVSLDAKPKPSDTPETYLARLAASGVRCVEWTEIDYVQESNRLSRSVAENIVKLINEENTIPFIARYRKSMTQGMDADELRSVKNSLDRAKLMKHKANAIIKEIDKQGKWTAELHAFVHGTKSLNDLEQIHTMFKVTKGTLAERARDLGLGGPAKAIINGERVTPLHYYVDTKKEGLKNEEQIRGGIVHILADMINKDERNFEKIRKLRSENSMQIHTVKIKSKEKEGKEPKLSKKKDEEGNKYDHYDNFSAFENNLKPHAILAINRGEARKILSVKVVIPNRFEQAFKEHCMSQYQFALNVSQLHKTLLTAAIEYTWNKMITRSVKSRTRHELNERAEIASMDVFADNVKQLLLTAPVRGKVVLGVDPGFRHGCKMAVVSEQGDLLQTETIYPHESNNPALVQGAERALVRMVIEYKCTILALGNGTACRETEVFLSDLIKKRAFGSLSVVYAIVDETGASIYSCSPEAKKEFPNLDANVVSAVSIARRLQDPMAELVKIEPKHLGVGMYQHDLPEKQLAAKLNEVIMEAVSFVGVDINTASSSLLKRVAGLGESKAKSIIEYRKSSGPFRTRNDLKKVRGIGSKTFEQCAGFIRIMPETAGSNDRRSTQEPLNYLDQTWIHPESYDIAKAFVAAVKCNPDQLGTNAFIFAVTVYASQGYEVLANKFKTSVETIDIIVKGLSMEKGQDIRTKGDKSMFRDRLTSFDDLNIGTILTGVIRNPTHFGAFVDVGIEKDGLIHKSRMGGMTLNVGQRVQVEVSTLDKERLRLGLTLVKCL